MWILKAFLVCAIYFGGITYGVAGSYILGHMLSFSFLTSKHKSRRYHHHSLHPLHEVWSLASAPAPAPGLFHPKNIHGYSPRHRNRHWHIPQSHLPSTDATDLNGKKPTHDCSDLFCSEPLTISPIGSPCGCVLPLKVKLELGVAPFFVFTVVSELGAEVADGTFVKQSQVRVMSAKASGLNKTQVDINIVPLRNKLDNITASVIYQRFWQKKVPINKTLFGDFEVIFVQYPGLPSSPPSMHGVVASGAHELPIATHIPSENDHKSNSKAIAILTLSSFVVLLVLIGLFYIFFKLCKFKKPSTYIGPKCTPSITKGMMKSLMMPKVFASSDSFFQASNFPPFPPSVKIYTLAEINLATEKFSSDKILGEGGFGRVYLGILEDGTEVAMKLLIKESHDRDREFIAEVEMLSRLHHRNLITLFGICIEGHTRCLVYEYVQNGSVESNLHGVGMENSFLDWDSRMMIALGAARGLAYLHEDSNPNVIHRDFKTGNILLDRDFIPKISDFGLAREASVGDNHILTRVMGTFGYVAPEYAMTGHLLVKSDVYSYGVVLLELLSGRKAIDVSRPQGQENLVTWARPLLEGREGLEQLVDLSLGGNFVYDDMARVVAIASLCVHPEVSQRPFMSEVVQALKLICNDTDDCESGEVQ